MRNIILSLILIVACGLSSQAQYKSWAIEAGVGNHYIADQSAVAGDNSLGFNLTVRKNLSRTFGLGLYTSYDKLDLITFDGDRTTTKYWRATLEGVVDVSNLLEIENDVFTLLGHGGAGAARLTGGTLDNVRYTLVAGVGATGLFKLSDGFALKVDWTTLINGNQDTTLDGAFDVTNAQANSLVNTLSVGTVFYIGRKSKGKKVHADWYSEPEPQYEIINVTNEGPVTNTFVSQVAECNCSANENVYFENDEDEIKIQGLNAIEKIFNLLAKDSEATVELTGSASPTASTTVAYDLDLSKRRVEAVKGKLIDLGLDASRITTKYIGKDNSRQVIHEFARKVSLEVKQ